MGCADSKDKDSTATKKSKASTPPPGKRSPDPEPTEQKEQKASSKDKGKYADDNPPPPPDEQAAQQQAEQKQEDRAQDQEEEEQKEEHQDPAPIEEEGPPPPPPPPRPLTPLTQQQMDAFKASVEDLVNDWDVWSVVSFDQSKREAVIQRSDEDQASVTIFAPTTYPKGELRLTHVFGKVSKQRDCDTIGDALDNALEEWEGFQGGIGQRAESLMMMSAAGGHVSGVYGGGGGGGACFEDQTKDPEGTASIFEHCAHKEIPVHGHYYDVSRKCHVIRLGIPLKQLMDEFRARALGLNRDYTLVTELSWQWGYLAKDDLPRVSNVYQVPQSIVKKDVPLDIKTEHHVGALKWYLQNRIRESLRRNHLVRDRRQSGISADRETQSVKQLFGWDWSGTYENFEHHCPNILVGIQRVVNHRVENCTGVCIICDDKLPLDGMKTAICDSDLCRHGLENYGLGTDVVAELHKSAEVCELLISACCGGTAKGSERDTFNPMCPIMVDEVSTGPHYKGPQHFYNGKYGTGTKNFDLLSSTARKIPSIQQLLQMSQGRNDILRAQLNEQDPLIFPLLQWILSSNRTHMEPIPWEHHFKGVGPHQFHLISASPEKEAKFRVKRDAAAKLGRGRAKRGSFWTWHGSGSGNWHAILRSGLKNYSGTSLMSTGAIFGGGIYTARKIDVSISYMRSPFGPWPNSSLLKHKNGLLMMALCEIADDPTGYKVIDNGSQGEYVTIQNEDLLVTRFLFVFPDGFHGDTTLVTDTMDFPRVFLE